MFELDDKVEESIIFAMENQETVSYVNTETGELSSRAENPEAMAEASDGDIPQYELIPQWTSQDGFHLMEQFAQTIGNPIVRTELLAALSRGRGVFRAFKDTLDAHSEAGKKWYEYKARAMKARIVRWYEDLRDAYGLERLGLEPEDTDDLLLSDFQILRYGPERRKDLERLLKASHEDALSRFPLAYVEYEFARMDREMTESVFGEYSIYVAECDPQEYAGMAIIRTTNTAEGTFSMLVFIYVDTERRRIGLGRKLAEFAHEESVQAGIRYFIVDVPFLWQEFGASLESLGYTPFGTRWLSVSDA